MHNRPSCLADQAKWIVGCLVLVPIFMTSGCAHELNLVPEGYYEILKKNIKGDMALQFGSSEAARLDYPITVSVNPGDKQIPINWTKDGELDKTKPFTVKVTWWRFYLVALNAPPGTPPLCYTNWAKPPAGDIEEFPCTFDVKDYIAKPLMGILDFRLGGDEVNSPGENEEYGTNPRLYYLVYK